MKNNILLGVTGSVACSKSEKFVTKYKSSYNFKIIATHDSLNFLSTKFKKENNIFSNWSDLQGSPHIDMARWADIFLIYPATANAIAKINSGIADDLLTSTALMYSKPIYICPAMHEEMFLNTKTQENLLELSKSHFILGPRYGNLDIGDVGLGRLIEPEEIYKVLNKNKETVIVTAGPTIESIDDVKSISNKSSGKQGTAIAIELIARGYEVIFLHSNSINPIHAAKNFSFESSSDLFELLNYYAAKAKYLFMVAAVSDFIPEKFPGKIDRKKGNLNLKLNANRDLVKEIKKSFPKLICIAFSAQINDELNFKKIKDKNVDYLVVNNILKNPFGSNSNKVSLIDKENLILETNVVSKHYIAYQIIENLNL